MLELTTEQFDVLTNLKYTLKIDENYTMYIITNEIPKELTNHEYFYEDFNIRIYSGVGLEINGQLKDLFDHFEIVNFDRDNFIYSHEHVKTIYDNICYVMGKLNAK